MSRTPKTAGRSSARAADSASQWPSDPGNGAGAPAAANGARPTARRPGRGRAAHRLLNRELSSLDFTARVLELAADAELPLLERVRFCSLVSQQLDEFFQVRVAGLIDQAEAGVAALSPDGRTAREALASIRARVLELVDRRARIWHMELVPALAGEGILIGSLDGCTAEELAELELRFEHEIYPVLTPLAVGPGQPFPYISALSLSLVVVVRDPENGEERLARVKVPEGLPRFIQVGERGRFLLLEDVIGHFLPRLFPQMEIVERACFRVTRDADLEVSDEADDLLEAVELELRRRRFGDVVRVEVSDEASAAVRERLARGLAVADDQIYSVPRPLALADLSQLARLDRPELKFEPWSPAPSGRFASAHNAADLFDEIRAADVLVHHPYESFSSTFGSFLHTAATDVDVVALKTTVYRTSDESPLVPSLIDAAEDGKQTVCLVELKARFDERHNIEWSRALEQAGVHVVYGFPNLKIHAKATLVVRREGDTLRRYVHLGTGNYHALTALAYEDFGLFTADPDIAADVSDFFNYVTGFARPQRFRKLLVAPFNLRDGLLERIWRATEVAAAGGDARIRFKLNALTDPPIIDALYEASRAGVQIDLLARSICALRPGVKGMSENIRVRSLVGRFLEHSRVYNFEVAGESSWLLGSADLMPRNLDHRLEIVAPVEDARAHARLAEVFDALLRDPAAWQLAADGTWQTPAAPSGGPPVGAQAALMRAAERRTETPRRTLSALRQVAAKSGKHRGRGRGRHGDR
jgi:polyphosphate kinase